MSVTVTELKGVVRAVGERLLQAEMSTPKGHSDGLREFDLQWTPFPEELLQVGAEFDMVIKSRPGEMEMTVTKRLDLNLEYWVGRSVGGVGEKWTIETKGEICVFSGADHPEAFCIPISMTPTSSIEMGRWVGVFVQGVIVGDQSRRDKIRAVLGAKL